MKTTDALRILTEVGYAVRFEGGAWLVTLWKGCVERMNRMELIQLAKDLEYVLAK